MPYRLIKSADHYRGTFLFLAGVMFLTPAIGFLFDHRSLSEMGGLDWLPEFIAVWHLGFVLAASSLFASVVGLNSRRWARHIKLVSYAYLAAMLPPILVIGLGLWAIMNGSAVVPWLISLPMYVALAAMIYLGSEWPNPPRQPTWPTALPPMPPEVE